MNKRLKYIIGIGIVLICLMAFSKPIFEKFANTDTIVNKIGCRMFELNTILVETESDFDLKQIQIKINNRTVFKDGQQKNKIRQEYGHNIFEIYYADLLIAEVGHFRRNNWYTNQYAFNISKGGTDFIVKHQISGPDASNANYQKRYVYEDLKNLIQIEYLNEQGQVYNIEKKSGNTVYNK